MKLRRKKQIIKKRGEIKVGGFGVSDEEKDTNYLHRLFPFLPHSQGSRHRTLHTG